MSVLTILSWELSAILCWRCWRAARFGILVFGETDWAVVDDLDKGCDNRRELAASYECRLSTSRESRREGLRVMSKVSMPKYVPQSYS